MPILSTLKISFYSVLVLKCSLEQGLLSLWPVIPTVWIVINFVLSVKNLVDLLVWDFLVINLKACFHSCFYLGQKDGYTMYEWPFLLRSIDVLCHSQTIWIKYGNNGQKQCTAKYLFVIYFLCTVRLRIVDLLLFIQHTYVAV